jgi:hypothetical protein
MESSILQTNSCWLLESQALSELRRETLIIFGLVEVVRSHVGVGE